MDEHGKKRFTLIELLIVIAIIAILAAILLPSLSRAKEQARRVICINNQSQSSKALILYADDFDALMPPGPPIKGTNLGQWLNYKNRQDPYQLGFLYKYNYINDAIVFYCPTWSYRIAQYDHNEGSYGGFPAPGNAGPSGWWWISYGYRTQPEPNRAVDISKDDPGTAILADHWTRRKDNNDGWTKGTGYWSHAEGYATTYLDGHSIFLDDSSKEIIAEAPTHTDDPKIELFWEAYFDK